LGRFGPFRYYTKVDSKLAEQGLLTDKFSKQSRVRIFGNERTRSTPLDPKLMFWGVSDRFVTARKSTQNWPNWCHYRTSSLNNVASGFFATNAPDPLHWTQKSCLGRFGLSRYCTKVDAKLAELVPLSHNFAKQSRVGIFRNERTRYTPLDPKLMFWERFGPSRYCMKVDAKLAELVPLSHNFTEKVASEFFATNAADPLHLTQNSCFRGVSDRFVFARKSLQKWPNWCH
jgi:hypothetical protein